MRLFIALEVPETWRAAAAAQQEAIASMLPEATRAALRPVHPDLLHVTLRFLGEMDEGAIDPLQAALDGVPPFVVELSLTRAGTFGSAARTGVVWLGIGGQVRRLGGIAGDIERALRLIGVKGDDRPLAAHLTLARLSRHATTEDRVAVAEAVKRLDAPPPAPYFTSELVLVRSYLEGPSPRYEVLSHHP
ncbi:MAG: RNA 2',3'-cyclic phosphodiesterase [Dehalococcoidia bacterium]